MFLLRSRLGILSISGVRSHNNVSRIIVDLICSPRITGLSRNYRPFGGNFLKILLGGSSNDWR